MTVRFITNTRLIPGLRYMVEEASRITDIPVQFSDQPMPYSAGNDREGLMFDQDGIARSFNVYDPGTVAGTHGSLFISTEHMGDLTKWWDAYEEIKARPKKLES